MYYVYIKQLEVDMYKQDVIDYFDTQTAIQKALGYRHRSTISRWGDIIPESAALKLDRLTKGKKDRLVYKPELYKTEIEK